MADPVTAGLAVVSTVATVAGGINSASGAREQAEGAQQQAEANAAAGRYKAQVARNNAIIADRNASTSREAGRTIAQTNDLKIRGQTGQILAEQGASGIEVGSGSPTDIRQSLHDLGHLDTLTILANAMNNAQGFKIQSSNFESEARLDEMGAAQSVKAGEYAQKAGDYAVASSVLGTASSLSDKWLNFKQKGVV